MTLKESITTWSLFLLTILGSTAISSCQNPKAQSNVKHQENYPINDIPSWNWIDITDEEYGKYVSPLIGVTPKKLSSDHRITKRITHWVNQIDQKLREKNPELLKRVPKPTVRVIPEDKINAFITPVPLCYKSKIIINENIEETSENTKKVVYFNSAEETLYDMSTFKCIEIEDEKILDEYIATFNQKGQNCKIQVSEINGEKILTPKGCKIEKSLKETSAAERVLFFSTVSQMNIFTGLIKLFTEEQIIAVIAHELGHYYKSHTTGMLGDYDYFYKTDEYNHLEKPIALTGLDQLAEDFSKASSFIRLTSNFNKDDALGVSPLLYSPMGGLGTRVCGWQKATIDECTVECTEYLDLIYSDNFANTIGLYPFKKVTAEGKTLLAEMTSKAEACLKTMPIIEDQEKMFEVLGLTWSGITDLFTTPIWGPNQETTQLEGLGSALEAFLDFKNKPEFMVESLKESRDINVWDMLMYFNDQVTKLTTETATNLIKQNTMDMGFYTAEQEADDFAIEVLNSLNIDPKYGIEMNLTLGEYVEKKYKSIFPTHLPMAECRKLYENNWMNEDGTPIMIPIGNFLDNHHSSCYRAFNSDRESKAHGYNNFMTAEAQKPTDSWKVIQELAEKESSNKEKNKEKDNNKSSLDLDDELFKILPFNKSCLLEHGMHKH